jgi:hypothetical protein
MSGETDLPKLLAAMKPKARRELFVFCTMPTESFERLTVKPIGWFKEREGVTMIVEKSAADKAGLYYTFTARMITLSVHSSLEAVGLLAAVTAKLASAGISVNVVSAYYHDHLFVPPEKTETALALLEELGKNI